MRNQKGFTLIEIVVSLGLFAILVVASTSLMVYISGTTKSMVSKTEDEIDTLVGERVVFYDFKNVSVSYNNLKIKDDSGAEFFRLIPDVSPLGKKLEPLVLTIDGKKRLEFVFAIIDEKRGPPILYNPADAYNVTNIPTDATKAGTLEIVGLNKGNRISATSEIWQDGSLLMLESPVSVRPVSVGLNWKGTPPRSPTFVGSINVSKLEKNDQLASLFNYGNPAKNSEIFTSLDQYLRALPSVGGSSSFVRIRPIQIIKYSVEFNKEMNVYQLARYRMVDGEFVDRFMFANGIKGLQLTRKSEFDAMISFQILK